jgi:hypothetical protein
MEENQRNQTQKLSTAMNWTRRQILAIAEGGVGKGEASPKATTNYIADS